METRFFYRKKGSEGKLRSNIVIDDIDEDNAIKSFERDFPELEWFKTETRPNG